MKKNLSSFIVAIITLLMTTMFIGCSPTTTEKETTDYMVKLNDGTKLSCTINPEF